MKTFEHELEVMKRAAYAAAVGLKRDFGRLSELEVHAKGTADFVSSADIASQRAIAELLGREFGAYAILGEEESETGATGAPRFVVDPLDGTTNFLHGIPHFAISIALEVDVEVVAGVVLDPIRGECFSATKGHGAFLGERRIRVTTTPRVEQSVIATGIPHRGRGEHATFLLMLGNVMRLCEGVRRFGAAALDLAYVGAGRFDAFFETGLARWDVAAGSLIVREAGGRLSELGGDGDPLQSGRILATNGAIHEALSSALLSAK